MGKSYTSSPLNTPLLFLPTGALPLDNRQVVDTKSDLTNASTFIVNGSDTSYVSMVVNVKNEGNLYTLMVKPSTNIENWKKIGNTIDIITDGSAQTDAPTADAVKTYINTKLQTFSGVFQFKGVADFIDHDFTIITVTPLSYNGVSDYKCTGFNYDLKHLIYYRWESGINPTYYTKAGDLTYKLYTISSTESSHVICVEHNEEVFYSDGVDNLKSKFTSLIGNSIYAGSILDPLNLSNTTFYSDSTTQTNDTKLFETIPIDYYTYSFNPELDGSTHVTASLGSGISIPASGIINQDSSVTSVNGWVYQIGEKEYASNGLIWVELGGPKQELNWLVI